MEKKEIIIRIIMFSMGVIMIGISVYAHISWVFDIPTPLFIIFAVIGTILVVGSVIPLDYTQIGG